MATKPKNHFPDATKMVPEPEMNAEFANRLRDPFEQTYMGVLRTNDPLLIERGSGGVELYRDLKRDGKVFSGLQKRQLALISKTYQVEPVEKGSAKASADAKQVTDILKRARFDKLCQELMEALIAGHAIAEIVWSVQDGLVVPERIPKRAQRRFVFVQDDEHSPPRLQLLTREDILKGVPVPERKFIVHRVNAEDDNPYGTGLGLQLWWPVYFKRKGIVAWNKLNERFGSPTPHGKYPRGASPKEKATLVDALRAMSTDGYLATPEGMEIALLESKLAGNVTTQEQLVRYMDEWIAEVLTGQEPAAQSGGALAAAAKERQNVRQDLTQADSDLLSETLNDTLLKWICELNGFEPCQVSRQIKEEDDTKALAGTDKLLHDMGYELDEDSLRAKYGDGYRRRAAPAAAPALPLAGEVGGEGAPARQNTVGKSASLASSPDKPASFAEPAATSATVKLTRNLASASGAIVDGWIDRIQAMVIDPANDDPATLQDALLDAYGDLPTTQLQGLMQLAFALAQLQGMDAAAQESADG